MFCNIRPLEAYILKYLTFGGLCSELSPLPLQPGAAERCRHLPALHRRNTSSHGENQAPLLPALTRGFPLIFCFL